jgi:glycerol uptake facilitator-like aquaporin
MAYPSAMEKREDRSESTLRRAVADGLGTALLAIVVVGSGILAEQISGRNLSLVLLANSLATGLGLVALIFAFAARSGAHFNPAVTVALALQGKVPGREVLPFAIAQFAGAFLGVLAVHAMFKLRIVQYGVQVHSGAAQWWSEVVGTFGLVFVVLSCDRKSLPFALGAYVAAAYWFTASTGFANPALTLARGFTASFAGIRLVDVAGFVFAQLFGMALAIAADKFFFDERKDDRQAD